MQEKIRLLIHGGAGIIRITEENRAHIEHNLMLLQEVVTANYQTLLAGASALDVAEQAVIELENFDGFNAGHGSVLNGNGIAELDAAIMDGRNLAVGAVAAAQRIRNPISGARAVMEYSHHVMLAGPNADLFCESHRVEMAHPSYFITKERQEQLEKALKEGHAQDVDSLGTVGAVVRDIHGNLAAATSTGGKANKLPGRVGDSPIIGCGTWADNSTCAISCTGDGEVFIRCAFAHEVAARIQFNVCDLHAACLEMLEKIETLGGEGGCIAIDRNGNYTLPFNTPGMYRGWVDEQGVAHSAVE